jgi:hypothetical protein
MIARLTVAEYHDHDNSNDGYCEACGEWTTGGCEPDAREIPCEACGEPKVFGTEEALVEGLIEIV